MVLCSYANDQELNFSGSWPRLWNGEGDSVQELFLLLSSNSNITFIQLIKFSKFHKV